MNLEIPLILVIPLIVLLCILLRAFCKKASKKFMAVAIFSAAVITVVGWNYVHFKASLITGSTGF